MREIKKEGASQRTAKRAAENTRYREEEERCDALARMIDQETNDSLQSLRL